LPGSGYLTAGFQLSLLIVIVSLRSAEEGEIDSLLLFIICLILEAGLTIIVFGVFPEPKNYIGLALSGI